MREVLIHVGLLSVGLIVGFLGSAMLASNKIDKLERLLAAKRRRGPDKGPPMDPVGIVEDEDPLPDREKLAAQREDAAEARHELTRERVEEVIRELKERCR